MPGQSVGVVAAQNAHFEQPLQLRSGAVLPAYDLVLSLIHISEPTRPY